MVYWYLYLKGKCRWPKFWKETIKLTQTIDSGFLWWFFVCCGFAIVRVTAITTATWCCSLFVDREIHRLNCWFVDNSGLLRCWCFVGITAAATRRSCFLCCLLNWFSSRCCFSWYGGSLLILIVIIRWVRIWRRILFLVICEISWWWCCRFCYSYNVTLLL